jgi:hypothetical protein
MKKYDLAVIGSGPAGVMAAKATARKGMSVLMVEKGKDLAHRKDLASGWFGHGLFLMDRLELTDLAFGNPKMIREAFRIVQRLLGNKPRVFGRGSAKHCFLPPGFGETIAKYFLGMIVRNVDIAFNTEIDSIRLEDGGFTIGSLKKRFWATRCLVATGCNSFEWMERMCQSLELPFVKSVARIGIRAELPLFRAGDLSETADQELCRDMRINSFVGEWEDSGLLSSIAYSLPERKSGKVSFMVGAETDQMDDAVRSVKIVNVLTNDKIRVERANDYLEGRSVLQHIECFSVLDEAFRRLGEMIPAFAAHAVVHIPEIRPLGILQVGEDMRTPIPNFYGAGECTSRVSTTLGAMASGLMAAKTMLKE